MGIKESKKFVIGSVHENGSGKFEILERYADNEEKAVMLKYRFLGNDVVETNKELNINASIWKFKKVRGLTDKQLNKAGNENEFSFSLDEFIKKIDEVTKEFTPKLESIFYNTQHIDKLNKSFEDQNKLIKELLEIVHIQQKQIDSLVKDNQIINKLLEKI